MDLDLPRSTASLALMVAAAAEHGLDPADVLAGNGVTPRHVGDPTAEVTGRQEATALANLARLAGDPVGVGLDLGRRYHVTTYGIWGFALASSPTVRSAIELGLRYLALTFALVDLAFEEDADGAVLTLTADHLEEGVRATALARDAAALVTLASDLGAEPATLRRMDLAVPRPRSAGMVALVGAPVNFDAASSMALLDASRLDQPLPQANPHTAALCEAQCRDLLARRRQRVGLAGQVRDRLLADPSRMPAMAEVAGDHFVTERTLRRQLAAEGTSFRALADEVRDALATELLRDGLTVEETAHRLGFAEPAAFIHAFRRWHGTTPGAWQVRQRPGRAARRAVR